VFVLSNQDHTWNDGQVKIIEVKSVQSTRLQFPSKLGKLYNASQPAFGQILSARRLSMFVWKQHREEPFIDASS